MSEVGSRNDAKWWFRGTFADRLDEGERKRLLSLVRSRRTFMDKEVVLSEGDCAKHVLLIHQGRVSVRKRDGDGKYRPIAIRECGDIIGELAFLDGQPRSASVLAIGKTVTMCIDHCDFRGFLDTCPHARLAFDRLLAKRQRETDQLYVESMLPVRAKVIRRLCELAQDTGVVGPEICVPITQSRLAEKVGAIESSVHRELARLAREGLLETGNRRIVIRDIDRLCQIRDSLYFNQVMCFDLGNRQCRVHSETPPTSPGWKPYAVSGFAVAIHRDIDRHRQLQPWWIYPALHTVAGRRAGGANG